MKKVILSLVLFCSFSAQASSVRDLSLLNRFYTVTNVSPTGVSSAGLLAAMKGFEKTLSGTELSTFVEMEKTLLSFQPLLKNDGSIFYGQGMGYSYFQNKFILETQNLFEKLHAKYGKTGDDFFTEDEFAYGVFSNANVEALYKLGLLDPTIPRIGNKLFLDMNLFTPVSDGNDQVSFQEFVYYAMMYNSSAKMRQNLMFVIVPKCDQNLGQDILGYTWIPAQCFRAEFLNKIEYYLGNFPNLKYYFSQLDAQSKNKVLTWLEHASRRNGYSEDYVGSYDYLAIPMMLHKVEMLLTRYDLNLTGILDKPEILNMFPLFKVLLAKKAAIQTSETYFLTGVFTYIFKNQAFPNIDTVTGMHKFSWWLGVYKLPATKVSTDRSGLFNFMCLMAAPENYQPNSANICAQ